MLLLMIIIVLSAALTTFFGAMALFWPTPRDVAQVRFREQVQRINQPSKAVVDRELEKPFTERIVRPALRRASQLMVRFLPKAGQDALREKLIQLNVPWLGVSEFMGARVFATAVGLLMGAVAWVLLGTLGMDALMIRFFCVGICAICFGYIPDYFLNKAMEKRHYLISRALPDTIDLLIVSIESGLGFAQAMQKVVQKFRGPLPDEFARCLYEMQMGRLSAEALRGMAKRVNLPDMNTFISAVVQAEQLGVSIGRVLRIQSQIIRERRSQRLREEASKLPVKMLIPMVGCMFPAIFMVVLGPTLMKVSQVLDAVGH